jgi:hypothetical protein
LCATRASLVSVILCETDEEGKGEKVTEQLKMADGGTFMK